MIFMLYSCNCKTGKMERQKQRVQIQDIGQTGDQNGDRNGGQNGDQNGDTNGDQDSKEQAKDYQVQTLENQRNHSENNESRVLTSKKQPRNVIERS